MNVQYKLQIKGSEYQVMDELTKNPEPSTLHPKYSPINLKDQKTKKIIFKIYNHEV